MRNFIPVCDTESSAPDQTQRRSITDTKQNGIIASRVLVDFFPLWTRLPVVGNRESAIFDQRINIFGLRNRRHSSLRSFRSLGYDTSICVVLLRNRIETSFRTTNHATTIVRRCEFNDSESLPSLWIFSDSIFERKRRLLGTTVHFHSSICLL